MKKIDLKILIGGIIMATASMMAGCKKDLATPQSTAAGTPSKLKVNSAGDNKYDLLGFGYDVTGEFASSSSATYKVIDIDKLVADQPDRYVPDLNVTQYSEYYAGGNADDYTTSLSQTYSATLGLKAFSGTLKGSFKETSTISSKYAYASASQIIRQKRLKFDAPLDLIKSTYLTTLFKSDLSSLTPQQLVTKYGTHVLTDITLGAKLNVFYRSQTSSSNRTQAVTAGMSANGLFKVFSITADIDYSTADVSSNYNQTLFYSTVGGDGTKGLFGEITLDNSAPKINIGNWQSSCTPSNAALIQIDKNGLILLSDLIDDAAKKQAVKTYIDQYIANSHITIVNDNYPAVPLYRCLNTKTNDRLLTTNAGEVSGQANWRIESQFGLIYTNQATPGTKALYRYFFKNGQHFFTTDFNELHGGSSTVTYEGVVGYVNIAQDAGTLPIYRYNATKGGGHFYTNNFSEIGYGGSSGYTYEGIIGYIQQ